MRDNVYGGPHDDAVRRDFTVNSLFYDVDEQIVIDYTGGFSDISKRVLRTIGDAHIRLCEDPIRILRAIKFSCRLDLRIEPEQVAAMREHVPEIARSAPPRIKEDIIRILSCGASRKALRMLLDLGVFRIVFPALQETLDREATYYGSSLSGREFLERLAETMDKIDRGRRRQSDALFLAIILSHHVGVCLQDTTERGTQIHDLPGFVDGIIRPIAAPMGVSRRDINMIKQIFSAYPRFERKKWRGRPRPNEFVRRDYFYESLVFYRLVAQGLEKDPSFHDHWMDKFEELRNNSGWPESGGPKKAGSRHGGSRRGRSRHRSKRRPGKSNANDNPAREH